MKSLELKVPPLLLVVLCGAAMWIGAALLPALEFSVPGRGVMAGLLLILGLAVVLAGVLSFRRAGTTVNPIALEDTSSVVTTGIYRVSRNPMYLGFVLVLSGWAVFLAHPLPFLFLPAFVLYLNRFQIKPEERMLSAKFGADFADYTQRAGRWLKLRFRY